MSSFVNPMEKYPSPRNTRSGAASSRSSAKASSATSAQAKTRKAQQPTPRGAGGKRATRSRSTEVDAAPHTAAVHGSKAQPDLAPLGEEDSEENDAGQQLNEELENEGVPNSPNGHDVSGATLLNEENEEDEEDEQPGAVNPTGMIESLPNLQQAATRLLDFFASSFTSPSRIADLARQLANKKSDPSTRLAILRSNFSLQKQYFGSEVYISVERIATILPPVPFSSKTWRADGIIYKSNCAQLALEILTRISMTNDAQDSMYALEGHFPLSFLKALEDSNVVDNAGISGLRRPTFDLALDVRTQFLKNRLLTEKDGKDYDPIAILNDVFFNEILESQPAANTPAPLQGFNLLGFLQDKDGNLPEKYAEDVRERIREIQACFKKQGQVDHDALEQRFSWEEFIFTVAKWLRSRNEELSLHLKEQPSVDDIRDELEAKIKRPNPDGEVEVVQDTQTGEQAVPASQGPKQLLPAADLRERTSFGDRNSLVKFARLQKQLNTGIAAPGNKSKPNTPDFVQRIQNLASKPTGRTSLPVTPDFRQPIARPRAPEVSAEQSRRPAAAHQRLSLPAQRQHGNGQSFIDRQDRASRVSPIDSQRLDSGGPSSSRKRTRDVTFEDEDEDGEFERDSRHINVQDRRGQKPVQNAKRARYDNNNESDDVRELSTGFTPSPARRRPAASSSNAVVYRNEAREVERTADAVPVPVPRPSQSSPQKPPQTRRPWSREEDNQFIRLVEEYGTSWAEIKSKDAASEDPKLTYRDQGNLKDRARNLVMIMLKGGTPYNQLPTNFNRIPLKKADVENLRKKGIEIPDRAPARQSNYF